MPSVQQLIDEVAESRDQFLEAIASITELQAAWKPVDDCWNIIDITEHLFWAEQGAISGMWKTLYAIRDGRMQPEYDSVHSDLSIEQVIARTWQAKEKVPAMAAPRMGGSLAFWKASLASLQPVLQCFGEDLKNDELRLQAHPHPISGPLNFQQRIKFLCFHLNRHRNQACRLMEEMRSL